MQYALLLFQLLLAGVLLLAAQGKLLQPEQFISALQVSRIPTPFISIITFVIPFLELCLSFALVLGPSIFLPWIFASIVVLFSAFTLWMASVLLQNLQISCGCFGTASTTIGLQSIVRNLLLLEAAGGGFLISLHVSSILPSFSLWMVMIVLSLGMCLCLLQAFQRARPALVLSYQELIRTSEE